MPIGPAGPTKPGNPWGQKEEKKMAAFAVGCTIMDNRHEIEEEKSLYPLTKLPDLTTYPGLALPQSKKLTYHKLIHALSF